eukprot:8112104-Alexandrium_andersonii.AAC.1
MAALRSEGEACLRDHGGPERLRVGAVEVAAHDCIASASRQEGAPKLRPKLSAQGARAAVRGCHRDGGATATALHVRNDDPPFRAREAGGAQKCQALQRDEKGHAALPARTGRGSRGRH